MRSLITTIAILLTCSVAAQADLLWDNYLPGGQSYLGEEGPGFDGLSVKSSERNTRIDDSWTGDDAFFTDMVELQQIKWIGALAAEAGSEFTAADVIIFEAPGQFPIDPDNLGSLIKYQASNLPVNMDMGVWEQFDGNWRHMYEGAVDVPDVQLEAGHYFIAVRLVGNYYGQNYIATTGNGSTHSEFYPDTPTDSMGVFQSYSFLYPPYEPQWVLVDEVPGTAPSDYAYQIYGNIVPEPASIGLLALGLVALLRRR
ncbi:MAG: PEP-CTERM sorting domain-containing protein [Phycisphaerae bacterium]|jgi:hypothetical protein